MSNRLPLRDRLKDHPMFDTNDECDKCHELCEVLNETGNMLVCDRCIERMRDEAEARHEGNR